MAGRKLIQPPDHLSADYIIAQPDTLQYIIKSGESAADISGFGFHDPALNSQVSVPRNGLKPTPHFHASTTLITATT
jgi:hypothetical protein